VCPENHPQIACPVPKVGRIVERFNGTVRKECLNLNWFHSLDEVNDLPGHWYKSYNFDRPHSSLKYKTPVSFKSLNQNLYFRLVPVNGEEDTSSRFAI